VGCEKRLGLFGRFCLIAGLMFCLAPAAPASGQSSNSGFLRSGFVTETVVKALDSPTAFAVAVDGRILITQKAGSVWITNWGSAPARYCNQSYPPRRLH